MSESRIDNQQINMFVNFGLKLPAQEVLDRLKLGDLLKIKVAAERTKACFLERSMKIIVEWDD